jgi:PKD domain
VRRSTLAALSTAAAVGIAGPAVAAPTAPVVNPLPPFVRGASVPITWTPAAFTDPLSIARGQSLAISETPPLAVPGLTETASAFTWTPATGFSGPVSITVTGTERPCLDTQPDPTPTVCENQAPDPATTSSAPVTTTVDNTGPTGGSLSINGGDTYTRAPAVTLTATPATDPAGGVKVQLAEGATGVIPCTVATDSGCPQAVFTTLPFTLSGTADGFRAVRTIYRDGAVTVPATPLLDGNPSAIATDSIFLDRKAPTAVPTATPASVQVGKTVTFGSSGSKDDTDGADDSKIDNAGFTWTTPGATGTSGGASPTRSYATAGTKTVTLTVRDRAGNTSAPVNVTVTVTNPPPVVVTPPAGGGGGGTTGGGTTGGGATGGGGTTGGGGGGAAPAPARFVQKMRPIGRIIAGKQMKIGFQVRGRVIITVALYKVRPGGGLGRVVRTFTGLKSGRFGVRFIAPKAGRYRLVARTGGQRRTAPVTVLPAPVVAVEPPVPAASK